MKEVALEVTYDLEGTGSEACGRALALGSRSHGVWECPPVNAGGSR